MGEEKLYRPATVSKQAAISALFKARPDADLVSFRRVAQKNGEFIEDSQGTHYEATLRVAGDFPPKDDAPEESAPAEAPAEDAPDEAPEEAPADDDGAPEGDGPPDLAGDGDVKPKKMKPEEEMVSLLRQILHSLQGGAGPDGPGGDADLMGGGLDDATVGAPPAHGGLPGGPGGPGGGGPLPPPVPAPHKPGMGGGAFAHVASVESFKFERVEAKTMGNRALIVEAASLIPTHKVTKIERAEDKAILTMVKR